MSLYQTLRPKALDDMIGNEDALSSVLSMFSQPKNAWPHAILISGPSGSGKDTLAQILAREYMRGTDLTIIENNGGSARGIDAFREIGDRIRQMPFGGDTWIVIVGEAHKLTKDAKSSLLVPTETANEDVFYIFTTTDSQSFLNGTDGSLGTRLTHYQMKPVGDDELLRYLRRVSRQNREAGLPALTSDVLQYIVNVSDGSTRKALVELEKILPMTDITQMKRVITGGGAEDCAEIVNLCKCFMDGGTWADCALVLKSIRGEEPEKIRKSVVSYFSAVMLNNTGDVAKQASLVCSAFSKDSYLNGFNYIVAASYELLGD